MITGRHQKSVKNEYNTDIEDLSGIRQARTLSRLVGNTSIDTIKHEKKPLPV